MQLQGQWEAAVATLTPGQVQELETARAAPTQEVSCTAALARAEGAQTESIY